MPGPANLPEWLNVGNEVRIIGITMATFGHVDQHRGMITGVHLREDGLHVELTPYSSAYISKGWFPVEWAMRHCRTAEPAPEPEAEPDDIDNLAHIVEIIGEPFGEVPGWFQIGATFAWHDAPYVIEEMWHPLPEMEPLLRIRNMNTEEMSVEGGEVLRDGAEPLWTRQPLDQLNLEPILSLVAADLIAEITAEYERTQDMIRTMGVRILQAVRERRARLQESPPPPLVQEAPRVRGPSVWRRLLEKGGPDAVAGGAATSHRALEGDTTLGPKSELE
jgi:hypothetical protein